MKLTDWFVNGEKPVRKGVYEVNSFYEAPAYSYWTGNRWMWISVSVQRAFEHKGMPTGRLFNEVKWRGLAQEPKQ